MISIHKRRWVRQLLSEGQKQSDVARMAGISLRSVKRIASEPRSPRLTDGAEGRRRRIGRPSELRRYERLILLRLSTNPWCSSKSILDRLSEAGYTGGRSSAYQYVKRIREELMAVAELISASEEREPAAVTRTESRTGT